jgi:hypothetical protein
MDFNSLIKLLVPYMRHFSPQDKDDIFHTIALGMEESGEFNYNNIRDILHRYGCTMPAQMLCKVCSKDDTSEVLSCEWCGRYFHASCKKYTNFHCSCQCESIDVKICSSTTQHRQ